MLRLIFAGQFILVPINLTNYISRNQFLNQPDSIPKTAKINSSSGKIQLLLQLKSIPKPDVRRTALSVTMQFLINPSSKIINYLWWSSHIIMLFSYKNFLSPPTFPLKTLNLISRLNSQNQDQLSKILPPIIQNIATHIPKYGHPLSQGLSLKKWSPKISSLVTHQPKLIRF